MPMMQDLLWISKRQQQHPSTHAHPLKNTIRVSSDGIRHKFDGKQWRPLCESPNDGQECRNLAFRSALCQKHFYKPHLCEPPAPFPGIPRFSLKRSLIDTHEHDHLDEEDDDSIQLLENASMERDSPTARSHLRLNLDSLSDAEPVSARFPSRALLDCVTIVVVFSYLE